MTRFVLATLAISSASAQVATDQGVDFSIGAKAGLLLDRGVADVSSRNPDFTSIFRNETQRPVFGPTFEVQFKGRFAVEFSPTFRRSGFTNFSDNSGAFPAAVPPGEFATRSQMFRQSSSLWDLPLTGKYYFTKRNARVRPFVAAGFTAIRTSMQTDFYQRLENAARETRQQSFQGRGSSWETRPVAAAGVAFRSGRFSIVPEFRYVRENRGRNPGPRDRAEIFLGFRF